MKLGYSWKTSSRPEIVPMLRWLPRIGPVPGGSISASPVDIALMLDGLAVATASRIREKSSIRARVLSRVRQILSH
jgi:hypothetical protein